ncbi:hypothetical protein KPH14_000975 [Odynerus spinipes]|uniref:DUF4219 domain-containing protein n=1 Tax=Odynerus spinipes TaxID=1348599 RepID=A0AAD9REY4_9HYME|nr:hypothetical protein KPH14_000975 [Odynerus spinipes]
MAEHAVLPINKIEPLNNKNYYVWALKVAAVLRNRKLYREVIESQEPARVANEESEAGKKRIIWENKNDEAFSIIILTWSEEQAGQFLGETKAKVVWDELKRR